jgi:two-component system, OmpR family, alkaline phosphatase synthesis response regulator PhoP
VTAARVFQMRTPDILVVDDDADIRESLVLALELEGYRVDSARHGGEAWDALDAGCRPSLVFLDLAMPVLSGPELLARIRADERLRATPVVVLTAFGSLAAGVIGLAQQCLFKPVDLDVVLGLAARHCPRRAAV